MRGNPCPACPYGLLEGPEVGPWRCRRCQAEISLDPMNQLEIKPGPPLDMGQSVKLELPDRISDDALCRWAEEWLRCERECRGVRGGGE